MKKNFLYELKKLSPKEWRQFLAYIPVVTKSTLILSLLGFVKKAPDMESMEKKAIFQKVYGNKPYSDVLMRQLIFRVQQIYEQFLISQKSIHNEKDYLLLASTPQKKYHRKKIIDKIETQIQNEQYSIQFYRNKLYIAIEEQETIGESQIRTHEPNYQAVNDHFDRLFLIEKLKITCGALSFANINQYEYDFSFIESLEPYCNENITEEEGILYALYKTYLIHKYHDQDSFFLLLEFLSKNKLYKNEETDLILRMAGNFSIKEINKGHLKYFEHLYNIYNITIKNNCLKNENNEIEFNTYLNIITTAFRIQKFQWAHQFLDNHIQYLPAQSEDSNKLYLYARLYFEQKNYHKALQNLSMAEPKDFFGNILFRVLQLKCLFETDEVDLVNVQLENYRIYLLRHKSKTYHYKLQSTFIKYLKKINNLRTKQSGTKILTALQNESQIAEKQWLIQIIKN